MYCDNISLHVQGQSFQADIKRVVRGYDTALPLGFVLNDVQLENSSRRDMLTDLFCLV